jgi:hypothetical protein
VAVTATEVFERVGKLQASVDDLQTCILSTDEKILSIESDVTNLKDNLAKAGSRIDEATAGATAPEWDASGYGAEMDHIIAKVEEANNKTTQYTDKVSTVETIIAEVKREMSSVMASEQPPTAADLTTLHTHNDQEFDAAEGEVNTVRDEARTAITDARNSADAFVAKNTAQYDKNIEKYTTAKTNLNTVLDELQQDVTTISDSVGLVFSGITDQIDKVVADINTELDWVRTEIEAFVTAAIALEEVFAQLSTKVTKIMGKISTTIKPVRDVLTTQLVGIATVEASIEATIGPIKTQVEQLIAKLMTTKDAIEAAMGGFDAAKAHIDGLLSKVDEVWSSVESSIDTALAKVEGAKGELESADSSIESAMPQVDEFAATNPFLGGAAKTLMLTAQSAIKALEPQLPLLKQMVEGTGESTFSGLDTIKNQIDTARGQLESTIGRAQASADTVISQVEGVQSKVEGAQARVEDAHTKATAVTDQAKSGLTSADGQVGNLQDKAGQQLQGVQSKVDDTKGRIVGMRTSIQDSITSQVDRIGAVVAMLAGGISDQIQGIYSFVNGGVEEVQSQIDSIQTTANEPFEAVESQLATAKGLMDEQFDTVRAQIDKAEAALETLASGVAQRFSLSREEVHAAIDRLATVPPGKARAAALAENDKDLDRTSATTRAEVSGQVESSQTELGSDLDHMRETKAAADKEATRVQKAGEEFETSSAKTSDSLKTAEGALEDDEKKFDALKEDLASAKATTSQAKEGLANDLTAAQSAADEANTGMKDAQASMAGTSTSINASAAAASTAAQANMLNTEAMLRGVQENIDGVAKDVEAIAGELEAITKKGNAELQAAQDTINADIEALQTEVNKALADANSSADDLKSKCSALNSDLDSVKADCESAIEKAKQALREQGDEVDKVHPYQRDIPAIAGGPGRVSRASDPSLSQGNDTSVSTTANTSDGDSEPAASSTPDENTATSSASRTSKESKNGAGDSSSTAAKDTAEDEEATRGKQTGAVSGAKSAALGAESSGGQAEGVSTSGRGTNAGQTESTPQAPDDNTASNAPHDGPNAKAEKVDASAFGAEVQDNSALSTAAATTRANQAKATLTSLTDSAETGALSDTAPETLPDLATKPPEESNTDALVSKTKKDLSELTAGLGTLPQEVTTTDQAQKHLGNLPQNIGGTEMDSKGQEQLAGLAAEGADKTGTGGRPGAIEPAQIPSDSRASGVPDQGSSDATTGTQTAPASGGIQSTKVDTSEGNTQADDVSTDTTNSSDSVAPAEPTQSNDAALQNHTVSNQPQQSDKVRSSARPPATNDTDTRTPQPSSDRDTSITDAGNTAKTSAPEGPREPVTVGEAAEVGAEHAATESSVAGKDSTKRVKAVVEGDIEGRTAPPGASLEASGQSVAKTSLKATAAVAAAQQGLAGVGMSGPMPETSIRTEVDSKVSDHSTKSDLIGMGPSTQSGLQKAADATSDTQKHSHPVTTSPRTHGSSDANHEVSRKRHTETLNRDTDRPKPLPGAVADGAPIATKAAQKVTPLPRKVDDSNTSQQEVPTPKTGDSGTGTPPVRNRRNWWQRFLDLFKD